MFDAGGSARFVRYRVVVVFYSGGVFTLGHKDGTEQCFLIDGGYFEIAAS